MKIDEKLSFVVPCGDGRQSVKWLGVVAAYRSRMYKPNGFLREPQDDDKGTMPSDVIYANKSIDPTAKLCEVFEDGAEVLVEIEKKVELDDTNAPIHTPWQEKAFWSGDSEAAVIRRRGIESRKETKKAEERIKKEIERRRRESSRYDWARKQSHDVLLGHLENEEDVAVALELDWNRISSLLRVKSAEFRARLREHYRDFNSVYIRYAGVGRLGEPNGLTLLDFSHFVHVAKIAYVVNRDQQQHDDRDHVSRIFFESARGPLLSRAEFVSALITLTLLNLVNAASQEVKDSDRPSSVGSRRSSTTTTTTVRTPLEALDLLTKRNLLPFLAARRNGDDPFFVAFDSVATQNSLQNARPHLLRIFEKYTNEEEEEKGVTLDIMKRIMTDCGLVSLFCPNDSALGKLEKRTLDAFLLIQNDPPCNLELNGLAFAEFVETYCRVATGMDESSSSDLQTKISVCVERMCDYSLTL